MAKYFIDESEYRSFLKNAWKVPFILEDCFLKAIAEWVSYHATVLGVPNSYVVWPLLVATSYCAQLTFVYARHTLRANINIWIGCWTFRYDICFKV